MSKTEVVVMNWVINILAGIGAVSLLLVAAVVLAACHRPDPPPSTRASRQCRPSASVARRPRPTDPGSAAGPGLLDARRAWQQAVASKQAQDLAAFQAAVAMATAAQAQRAQQDLDVPPRSDPH
ncbi:hypothetical protein [Actinomyces bowdenii]|uniref:Uncharacterized protein n=1 Tax=Actinomyces bowdenii TaxID=131109 RepID=A0A3P1UT50_9ACTO|nr:hypothetical protein [Actinomyces bowdenii]RRD24778.1 hypothetical protein EII10_11040 [Actinomyces bowdenii]